MTEDKDTDTEKKVVETEETVSVETKTQNEEDWTEMRRFLKESYRDKLESR